jgi:hypothetical protein
MRIGPPMVLAETYPSKILTMLMAVNSVIRQHWTTAR